MSKWRSRLWQEQMHEAKDKKMKQQALLEANGMLIAEKSTKQKEDAQNRSLERINFFPFTHGDLIEKQRHVLGELQKQELLKNFKERKAASQRRKRDLQQARINQQVNNSLLMSGSGGFHTNPRNAGSRDNLSVTESEAQQ